MCDGIDCAAAPPGMVAVQGGPFMMGCNLDVEEDCFDDEYPYHEVTLGSFFIDRTEVTAAAYAECVDAGECSAPNATCDATIGERPVVCVGWFDARGYCEWMGRRLPTEAEWEKAARGTEGQRYPWGNSAPTCAHANLEFCNDVHETLPVGSKPAGASPYGALDMAGNVLEMTNDWYDPAYYAESPDTDPAGPADGSFRVVRSTSWNYNLTSGRAGFRAGFEGLPSYATAEHIGFRCASDP